jgi:hypothetical protein
VGKRTNRSTNPSAKNNSTDWFLPPGWGRSTSVTTLPRTTGIKGTSAPSNDIVSPRCAVTAGQTYFTSFSIHYTNTSGTNTFDYGIDWYKADGGYLSSTPYFTRGSAPFGITERLEFGPAVAPTGATSGVLVIASLDSGAEITAHLFEQTTQAGRTFFDGDSTTPFKATWTGTAGNSTSIEITASDAWGWSDAASTTATASGPVASDRFGWSESVSITGLTQMSEQWTFRDSAMVISLGYDERKGRVRVNAFGLDPNAVRAVVNSRPHGQGRWTPVRGGKVAINASGSFARIVDDYEFAAGFATDYQIVLYASAENTPDTIVGQAYATLAAIEPEVWLKFIAKPGLNRRLTLTGWDKVNRQNRNATFTVRGRPDPIVVTDVHGSRTTSIRVRTESIQDGDALDAALSSGYPAFLHTPLGLALPTMYVAIGDYGYERPSSYSHVRSWSIDLTEVAAPPASVFGPPTTWADIMAAYPTWRDLMNAFPTWRDVMGA